jgi:hypothetical protein
MAIGNGGVGFGAGLAIGLAVGGLSAAGVFAGLYYSNQRASQAQYTELLLARSEPEAEKNRLAAEAAQGGTAR